MGPVEPPGSCPARPGSGDSETGTPGRPPWASSWAEGRSGAPEVSVRRLLDIPRYKAHPLNPAAGPSAREPWRSADASEHAGRPRRESTQAAPVPGDPHGLTSSPVQRLRGSHSSINLFVHGSPGSSFLPAARPGNREPERPACPCPAPVSAEGGAQCPRLPGRGEEGHVGTAAGLWARPGPLPVLGVRLRTARSTRPGPPPHSALQGGPWPLRTQEEQLCPWGWALAGHHLCMRLSGRLSSGTPSCRWSP